MARPILTILLVAALTGPALAQGVKIDDDGWERNTAPPSAAPTIDIDDDGWSLSDKTDSGPLNETVNQSAGCTQLESSAGLSGDECGEKTRGELIDMMDG